MRSCHSTPRPAAAVVPAHLQWGTFEYSRWYSTYWQGSVGILTVVRTCQGYCEYSHLQYTAVRSCHSPPRPSASAAAVPAHLRFASGRPSRGDVRTARRARAPWMLSSVAGPAARSGVAPVVDNTWQRARPMQTAIMCACKGRSEPIRKCHVLCSPVQCSAAPGFAAAVLRSAVGASTKVRAVGEGI